MSLLPYRPYKMVTRSSIIREDIPSGLSYEALVAAFEHELGRWDPAVETALRRPTNDGEWLITFCSANEINQGEATLINDLKPVFNYFEENILFFSAMLSNKRTSVFRERLLTFVSANVKEKLDRQESKPSIDNELNAQFMASAFIGILEWWIQHKMPHPPAYMADQLSRLLERNEINSA
ncbi:TetR-like C-terminal domain-containing protein [Bacillus sp. FJAT-26390]|uniref:TetR-like C-terminal domain-containing protein n=1 Tax=Bacillus sp. FJAT-26390 TaxID=1743142 RepID=UPI000807F41A|nr:TetR-like C-terminal domain-containing protein [Bacillus sp. FJAT-26390]OBZ16465.1 hypothetical protein A7975_00585 [Bacillus sp. FJAT-26390]